MVTLAALASGVVAGERLTTRTKATELSPAERGAVTAKCPRGTKAVSGGFRTEEDAAFLEVDGSSKAGGRGWRAAAYNVGDAAGDLRALAYCRDEKLHKQSSRVTVPSGQFVSNVTSCPNRSPRLRAISGGFKAERPTSGESFLMAESRKVGRTGWLVRALNINADSLDLIAQVVCRKRKGVRAVSDDDHGGSGELEAKCRRNERVVSGGFAKQNPSEYLYPQQFFKSGSRAWRLHGDGLDAVRVFAYCERRN